MQVETPTLDELIESTAAAMNDTWNALNALNEGLSEPEHPCYSQAQQLGDRERVKLLRRQQYKKGRGFK